MQVLLWMIALVAAAEPAATPFPIGTLAPFGATPAPLSSLPNIGRVRANSPACAAMRDLIIPSFVAARQADARFAQTQVRLPQYADLIDDPLHRADVYRESALAKLDQDAGELLRDALIVNKALGDPRLSAEQTDPDVVAERKALEQLYDAEKTRANLLNEFVMRQRNAIATAGIDTSANDYAAPNGQAPTEQPHPSPVLTAPPGMPVLIGNNLSDRSQARQWGADLTANVAYNEDQAAKTFLPIARGCIK
ncbi:MAG TPA: hypothetical protein VHT05_00760 [Candidatus Elarobacter sp.]|jgi:hypothetical protein|nr:hypothetical protein [Candidatus Elarobacter sp.]